MKIHNLCRCILWLLITVQLPLFARAQTTNKRHPVIIDLVIDDPAMLQDAAIEFSMSKNDINTNYAIGTDLYRFKITAAKTMLVIPLSVSLNYGRIDYVYNKPGTGRPLNRSNNLFLFQQGDTVELHLSNQKNGAFFSGRSADTYNCMYKISNSDVIINNNQYNTYMRLKDYEAAFDCRKSQLDSILKVQSAILNSLKGKLSREIYNLIGLDCWGNYNQRLVEMYYTPFTLQTTEIYKTAKKLFIRDYGHYKEKILTDSNLFVLSYQYADFLFKKDRAYAVIMNSNAGKSHYPDLKFADINQAIDLNQDNGALRDKLKLLAFYEIDRRRQSDFVDFVNKAVSEAVNNQYKKALQEFSDNSAIGANAYPFELPDENGKIRQLKDFQGKVVVMDFWFTGCEGCIGMAAKLKPIISSFKANPDVIFITVSLDRNKTMWLKSLAAEKYSGKSEINLLAGMDRQSAIVKHYNIQGCPTIIIISKDGKIISVAPPDPRTDSKAFIAMVKQSL
ncbi:TlpA family protein disulfide reductase [Mucilaginibacter paludis]|uniref:Alkyl hydroperoxide reductase/ Thiol specific antioxidant/ Mal allergen n=1 Tax=Mucilaginibacter paludis DSM 18603 TaxID=714943 RepID=H1YI08_9SPHI|nr:TlpA disulfide reductase family protein [Mucilaginibacter paludis]EHQ25556.1 alkyl hydroperoxide reductase/ Thiol specific antioxidant/ Mal allergen [Mucilaginibacter paludis DSM 18603]